MFFITKTIDKSFGLNFCSVKFWTNLMSAHCLPFPVYIIQAFYGGKPAPSHGGDGGALSEIILPAGTHIVAIEVCNL